MSCHSELEYLRQHAATLADAQRLQVRAEDIAGSAHADSSCASCHTGFRRWPHSDEAATASCASCHEEQEELWSRSVHAEIDVLTGRATDCADCHGLHTVATSDEIVAGEALPVMNGACAGCHVTAAMPAGDPHADSTSCAGCHSPHSTRAVDDPESAVAPLNQLDGCGGCHEEARDQGRIDVHGSALSRATQEELAHRASDDHELPPTCSTCHGSHGMGPVTDTATVRALVGECSHCHEEAAEHYQETYHGKAVVLGSYIAATCSDCHRAHNIYPDSVPESSVHPDQLVETCGECHAESRAAFVLYQPHADHNDRDKSPQVYWAYRLMTGLLLGVFAVFGIHSALWMLRLQLDSRARRARGGA